MPADEFAQEIEDIIVDAYGEDEQLTAWEVAFQDQVETPFRASIFGVRVEVRGFRVEDNHVQCLAAGAGRERWLSIDALDPERPPDDYAHVVELYEAWRSGSY